MKVSYDGHGMLHILLGQSIFMIDNCKGQINAEDYSITMSVYGYIKNMFVF